MPIAQAYGTVLIAQCLQHSVLASLYNVHKQTQKLSQPKKKKNTNISAVSAHFSISGPNAEALSDWRFLHQSKLINTVEKVHWV